LEKKAHIFKGGLQTENSHGKRGSRETEKKGKRKGEGGPKKTPSLTKDNSGDDREGGKAGRLGGGKGKKGRL